MSGPAIRLHALNLGERGRERFEHLFGAAGRGAGMLCNEAVAEVVLVDLDGPDATACFSEYRRRHPEHPALLLAKHPAAVAARDQLLLKPVDLRSLLGTLLQMRRVLDQSDAVPGDERDFADTFPMPRSGAAELPAHHAPAAPMDSPAHEDDGVAEDPPTVVMSRLPVEQTAAPTETADEPPTMVLPRRATDLPAIPAVEPPEASAAGAKPTTPGEPAQDPARWHDHCGDRDDVDPHDEHAVTGLWLEPDALLLARLVDAARQALDTQRTLELRAGNLKIVIDGASDYAYADADEASVRALCAQGPVDGPMTVAPAGKPKAVLLSRSGNPTAHWSTVESALWQAALWTYRGRLPAGTALDERVYLSRWPNFTRLAELPHALRICALWVEQPLSLAATATVLRIPQRYVFALYGATQALGLSGPARRGADHLFATPPATLVPRRPLLGRLVRQLRSATPNAHTPASRAAG